MKKMAKAEWVSAFRLRLRLHSQAAAFTFPATEAEAVALQQKHFRTQDTLLRALIHKLDNVDRIANHDRHHFSRFSPLPAKPNMCACDTAAGRE